jgi:F-type H+-transporting ATPase subunit epsilon
MKSFKATFITPKGSLFTGTATSVVAPGQEGRFEVLAGHENIIAVLKKGVLKIKVETAETFFAIDSGVLEVDGNRDVIVLADKAIKADNEDDANKKISELDVV